MPIQIQQSPTDALRQCVLVLGMHRSGNSALCRLLNLAGAELPKSLVGATVGNELGHWEPKELVHLNDCTLLQLERSWCDWRPWDWAQHAGLALSYETEYMALLTQ